MDRKQSPLPVGTGNAGSRTLDSFDHTKSSLPKARAVLKAKREAARTIRRDPLEKACANPNSRRLAINAKCYDCKGRDADPCVEWRIGNCVCPDCPLYPVRPHQHLCGKPTPKALQF